MTADDPEEAPHPLADYLATASSFREMKIQYEPSALKSMERRISQLIPPEQRSREIDIMDRHAARDPLLGSIARSFKYPSDAFALHEWVAGAKAFAWLAFPDFRDVTAVVPFLGYRHGYLQAVMLVDENPPIVAIDSAVVGVYALTLARTIVIDGDSDELVNAKTDASIELLRFGWTREPERLSSAMAVLDRAGLAMGDGSEVAEWFHRSIYSEFCHYIICFFVLHEVGHAVQATKAESSFGPLDDSAECEEQADRFAMQCLMNVLGPRSLDCTMVAARAVSELFLTLAIRDRLQKPPVLGRDHADWDRRWARLHRDLADANITTRIESHLERSQALLLERAQRIRDA